MTKLILCVIPYILPKILILLSYSTIIKFSLRKLSLVFRAVSKTWPLNAISVLQPGGRWFKSNPRHQDKAKGSDNAPLQFLGPTTQMLNGAATSGLEPHLQALAQQLAQQMLAREATSTPEHNQ
jgi:hypothetical protein